MDVATSLHGVFAFVLFSFVLFSFDVFFFIFIFVFVIFERKRQKDRDRLRNRKRDREQERTKLVPAKGHVEKDRQKISENTFSPGESEREARELREEPLELNI